ncbi:MAG: CBS domain-containing protein [Gemmataceae bacterium]
MATARDILVHKGSNVLSISPTSTVLKAAQYMNEFKVGSLVVLVEGRLVGILTERDILTRVVATRRDPAETAVDEVMTTDLICCQPDTAPGGGARRDEEPPRSPSAGDGR